MRRLVIVALGIAVLGLPACRRVSDAEAGRDPTGQAGRNSYVGIGIYSPGASWRRLVDRVPTNANASSALKADDQAIIVVQNSRTGDIRICGDMTGYCVGMNPWARPAGQLAPVGLSKHEPNADDQ